MRFPGFPAGDWWAEGRTLGAGEGFLVGTTSALPIRLAGGARRSVRWRGAAATAPQFIQLPVPAEDRAGRCQLCQLEALEQRFE